MFNALKLRFKTVHNLFSEMRSSCIWNLSQLMNATQKVTQGLL